MHGQHQPGHTNRRKTEGAAKPTHHGTVRNVVKLQHKLHKEQRSGISKQLPVDGAHVHAHFARDRFFRRLGFILFCYQERILFKFVTINNVHEKCLPRYIFLLCKKYSKKGVSSV